MYRSCVGQSWKSRQGWTWTCTVKKFDRMHELLSEHNIEEELEQFFEELYGCESGSEYDTDSEGEAEPDADKEKDAKPEKKAIRIVALRSEGKLVGRQVTLDIFGDQKKSSEKKKVVDEDDEDCEEEEQPSTVQF
ncbi:unnamed protein product [Effrenium voratum]|nr:unnamed protein product [Effrenium voratum]